TVGNETRSCRAGRCLVFDDSFEHGVRNGSAQICFVLVVDFWHPELSDLEVEALDEIMRVSRKAEASRRIARRYPREATSVGR
ncbi:MAG: aspartyl/asparaginyl beta-hydroxylase domain-containing protein, partial [Candidatus Binatia bacterium]